jgi:hypothetical protein
MVVPREVVVVKSKSCSGLLEENPMVRNLSASITVPRYTQLDRQDDRRRGNAID